jgi:hypothetical protein
VQFPGEQILRSKVMVETTKRRSGFETLLASLVGIFAENIIPVQKQSLHIETTMDKRVTCLFLACESEPRIGVFLDHKYLVTWTVVAGVTSCNIQFWERGHIRVFQGYTILNPTEPVSFDILIGMRESARRACLGFEPELTCEHLNILFAHIRTLLRDQGEAITAAYVQNKAERHD